MKRVILYVANVTTSAIVICWLCAMFREPDTFRSMDRFLLYFTVASIGIWLKVLASALLRWRRNLKGVTS